MKTSFAVKLAGALLGFGLVTATAVPAHADWDDWRWKQRQCTWCRPHPVRCAWEVRARCGFDWDDRWRDRHHDRRWWERHRYDWDDRDRRDHRHRDHDRDRDRDRDHH
jgi:hypothetical protein